MRTEAPRSSSPLEYTRSGEPSTGPRVTTVGVVSDTHLPRFGTALPRALEEGLRTAGVTRIVHGGDHVDGLAVEALERIAPVDAVAGNNDGPELVRRFGRSKILTIEGVRIGLVHGDLGAGASTPERARRSFAPGTVDIVCFGHSHQPLVASYDGILLVNPGSPTDKRRESRYSYALLRLGDGPPRAEIVRYDDRRPGPTVPMFRRDPA